MSSAMQFFSDYIYIRLHFKSQNFLWNRRAKYQEFPESLESRNDEAFFYKMFSSFSKRNEWIEYFISCFIYDEDIWIGEMMGEEMKKRHDKRMKILSSLESIFVQGVEEIEFYLMHNDLQKRSPMDDPFFLNINIPIEVITLIDYFTDFTGYWFPISPLKKKKRLVIRKYWHLIDLQNRDQKKMLSAWEKLQNLTFLL